MTQENQAPVAHNNKSMHAVRSLPLLTLLLLHLASPATATAATTCTSSHDDDITHAGCFGWCSAAFSDHCSWCRCKGCPFCAADGTAATAAPAITSGTTTSTSAISQPASTSSAIGGVAGGDGGAAAATAVCTSTIQDDVSYKDCQPHCSSLYKADHCEVSAIFILFIRFACASRSCVCVCVPQACKCRACSFCACDSGKEGDVNEEGRVARGGQRDPPCSRRGGEASAGCVRQRWRGGAHVHHRVAVARHLLD